MKIVEARIETAYVGLAAIRSRNSRQRIESEPDAHRPTGGLNARKELSLGLLKGGVWHVVEKADLETGRIGVFEVSPLRRKGPDLLWPQVPRQFSMDYNRHDGHPLRCRRVGGGREAPLGTQPRASAGRLELDAGRMPAGAARVFVLNQFPPWLARGRR